MRPNLLGKLRTGRVLLGLSNMYPASGIIEGMCAGWEFVFIDGQHGQFSYDGALHAVQAAAAAGVDSVLRTPGHDPGLLGMYADLGPSAVVVPVVDTPQQAAAVARALRFAPQGNRSFGGRRVIDLDGREFYRSRELVVSVQIESAEAVENVERIIGTDGIDLLYFGPEDMKIQLGIPVATLNTDSKEIRAAMERTGRAARAAGKFCGCPATTPAMAKMSIELGYQLLVGGADGAFLQTSAAARLRELQAVVSDQAPPPTGPISAGDYGR